VNQHPLDLLGRVPSPKEKKKKRKKLALAFCSNSMKFASLHADARAGGAKDGLEGMAVKVRRPIPAAKQARLGLE
jgi:hypothetical protein